MSDYEWHDVDPYSDDESDCPTEAGYYDVVDTEGNRLTDFYSPEPFITRHGIGYWRDGKYPIIAWKRCKEKHGGKA